MREWQDRGVRRGGDRSYFFCSHLSLYKWLRLLMLFVASSFFRPFERAPLETGAIAGLRGLQIGT